MTPEEFRRHGYAMIDLIADYRENIEQRGVQPTTVPGEIKAALPASPPDSAEPFEQIMGDVEKLIMPGLLHWQHPSFFGFFPSNVELSSVLGDCLSTGLGVVGLPSCYRLSIQHLSRAWPTCVALTAISVCILLTSNPTSDRSHCPMGSRPMSMAYMNMKTAYTCGKAIRITGWSGWGLAMTIKSCTRTTRQLTPPG